MRSKYYIIRTPEGVEIQVKAKNKTEAMQLVKNGFGIEVGVYPFKKFKNYRVQSCSNYGVKHGSLK